MMKAKGLSGGKFDQDTDDWRDIIHIIFAHGTLAHNKPREISGKSSLIGLSFANPFD
jgi:hypothetical protein